MFSYTSDFFFLPKLFIVDVILCLVKVTKKLKYLLQKYANEAFTKTNASKEYEFSCVLRWNDGES